MQLLEEFTMLEQRIICKLLPRNFDSLDQLIISPHPRLYKPLVQDITSIEFKIQQQKIIQQVKRTWLNIYYNAYEIKIQEYEEQYKENLRLFQFLFECKPNINRVGALNAMKTYLTDRRKIYSNIVNVCQKPKNRSVYHLNQFSIYSTILSMNKNVNIFPKVNI
jgi:hypothetical protein